MTQYVVSTAAASLNFDTNNIGVRGAACKIDTNHLLAIVPGASSDGYAYVLTVNTSTWAVTTASSSLDFDTGYFRDGDLTVIDDNHFLALWRSVFVSGKAQVLTVNTTTWAVTTAGALFSFPASGEELQAEFRSAKIDTNHFLVAGQSYTSALGEAQVLTVDTSTWAITTAAAALNFASFPGVMGAVMKIDDTHFLANYKGQDNDGYAVVFAVNTSTWVVTTAAAALEFDTGHFNSGRLEQLDSNHFISIYAGTASEIGYIEVLTVNTSTWVITTSFARLNYDATQGNYPDIRKLDTNNFLATWAGTDNDGFAQTFTVNTTTYGITTGSAPFEFDTRWGAYNTLLQIDSSHFVNVWAAVSYWAQTLAVTTAAYGVDILGTALEFDTDYGGYNDVIQVDTNHFLLTWVATNGFYTKAQVFAVNTTTWAVTTAGATLTFNTNGTTPVSLASIDSTHFVVAYSGAGDDGFAVVLAVDTSTWTITTAAAAFEFDATNGGMPEVIKVDTNHFLCCYAGTSNNGVAVTLTVNTSTWVVTTAAATLTYDTAAGGGLWSRGYMIDANHAHIAWVSGLKTKTQILTVNTSTWAVTTAAASFQVTSDTSDTVKLVAIDSAHAFISFNRDTYDGYGQVLTVNTSTWVITTTAADFEFFTQNANIHDPLRLDTNHVAIWYGQIGGDAFCKTLELDTSTWAVSEKSPAKLYDTSIAGAGNDTFSAAFIDSSHAIHFWQGKDSDGFVQIFEFTQPPPTTSIKTIDGLAYLSVKTVNGLSLASMKTINGLA